MTKNSMQSRKGDRTKGNKRKGKKRRKKSRLGYSGSSCLLFSTNTLLFLNGLAQIVHCFVEKHLLVPALTAAECFVTSGEKRDKKRNNYIITEQ